MLKDRKMWKLSYLTSEFSNLVTKTIFPSFKRDSIFLGTFGAGAILDGNWYCTLSIQPLFCLLKATSSPKRRIFHLKSFTSEFFKAANSCKPLPINRPICESKFLSLFIPSRSITFNTEQNGLTSQRRLVSSRNSSTSAFELMHENTYDGASFNVPWRGYLVASSHRSCQAFIKCYTFCTLYILFVLKNLTVLFTFRYVFAIFKYIVLIHQSM